LDERIFHFQPAIEIFNYTHGIRRFFTIARQLVFRVSFPFTRISPIVKKWNACHSSVVWQHEIYYSMFCFSKLVKIFMERVLEFPFVEEEIIRIILKADFCRSRASQNLRF
jgi:hypothetical protein